MVMFGENATAWAEIGPVFEGGWWGERRGCWRRGRLFSLGL